MIRWQSSTQLTYSGAEFADLFRHTSEWSVVSHIVVDVLSAVEFVDNRGDAFAYALDVRLEIKNGGPRELHSLTTFIADRLEDAWTVTTEYGHLRCRFDTNRRQNAARP